MKKRIVFSVATGIGAAFLTGAALLSAAVTPEEVVAVLAPGESMEIEKQVTTPEIPPEVDVCLLEDETGSFGDDIGNLQSGTTASDIYDAITAVSPGAHFAVAGFRDYPVAPFGNPGDHVYRLLSFMSPVKTDWINGINALTAGGGADFPEAQYDAIVAAAGPGAFNDPTAGVQGNCGWRDKAATPGVQRILVVTTDAAFHLPGAGKPHVNDHASSVAALNAQGIIVIGLKAPGAGGELDALAGATGGSVQPLSSSGDNIADAILSGLSEVTTDVWHETPVCDAGLSVTLSPGVHEDVAGGTTVSFDETVTVDNDPALEGKELHCSVVFVSNSFPEEGAEIGTQEIWITVPDVTPPVASCVETVNPHGKNTPRAGQKSPGQNEDGFYLLGAEDNLDPNPTIWVSGFGPFAPGDRVKVTEATGATPTMKKMGSTQSGNNGKSDAIAAHLILDADAIVTAVDGAGNVSPAVSCLVPRPPK